RLVVDELLGVLTRTKQPKGTIGIIVGPSMNSFTPGAIDAVLEIAEPPEPSEPLEQLPTYPIIATDGINQSSVNTISTKIKNSNDTLASNISNNASNSDVYQETGMSVPLIRNKIQYPVLPILQKFMSEVSKNSSSQLKYTDSISNSNAKSDVISTTLNETEELRTQCFASSQLSNTSFMFLYEKLCDAIILANPSEKQVDPESNIVSRILNKEIESTLKSKNPELSSGSDDENHMFKPSSSEDISNIEVSALPEKKEYQVLSEKTSNPKNRKNPKNNSPNLFPLKKMLLKEKHKEVINKLTMHFTDSPKLDLYFSIDKEGEHQFDAYWVLGSYCPLCRENHMSLQGIPLDEVLNAVPNQPIVRNHALKFPDKSVAVEA
ncbi:10867_t:CDS:2, partial [Gigaspora margarita]